MLAVSELRAQRPVWHSLWVHLVRRLFWRVRVMCLSHGSIRASAMIDLNPLQLSDSCIDVEFMAFEPLQLSDPYSLYCTNATC